MSYYQILPECYADTLLVEILGFKQPSHQLGIGKVISVLDKNFKNRNAVGIIDDDKVKPKDLDSFELCGNEWSIKRLCKGKHSVLIISPAFENWVFDNADMVNVDPAKHGFHTEKMFRNTCKRQDASRNENLRQFLNALKQKNAPGFLQLKSWICEGIGIKEDEIL